ncbi:MAG: hypothetical protein PF450_14030 [Bacteroidales bacterium]|jgi:hypothetical protein|nr:hypothetical protein [Bacteroidales bacterium]
MMTIHSIYPFQKIVRLTILIIIVLFNSSCEKKAVNLDGLREVCFDTEVFPIMQNSCATLNCHDIAAEHGYRLDSYTSIMKGIKPGDPLKSKIYTAIINTWEDRMPPDKSLSVDSRMLIRVWIDQGALETKCKDSLIVVITPPDTTILEPAWINPFACFERDILPVMASSCGITGCHDQTSMIEDYDFTTYDGILEGLIPGNPPGSKMYKSISEEEQSNLMPPLPYSRLPQAQVDSIYNWIQRGALNEDCGDACDTTDVTYTTHLSDILTISCTGCHSGATPSLDRTKLQQKHFYTNYAIPSAP